jgi:hypothetical protein
MSARNDSAAEIFIAKFDDGYTSDYPGQISTLFISQNLSLTEMSASVDIGASIGTAATANGG